MAALLYLRRRAAAVVGGAVPKPREQLAGLATAARHDALDGGGRGGEGGGGERNKSRWVELPPFAPLDAAAAARAIYQGVEGGDRGSSNSTAIRWVRRCCPHLPASLVQKLFRLRKVRTTCSTKCTIAFLPLSY